MNKSILTAFSMILGISVLFSQKPQPIEAFEIHLDEFEKIESYRDGNKRIDKNTNLPLALYGVSIQMEAGSPIEMASQYLKDNYALLGLRRPDLSDLKHHATRKTNAGTVVRFRQMHYSYPVNKAELTVNLSPSNVVTSVMNSYHSNLKLEDLTINISEQQAMDLANDYINPKRLMMESSSHLMVYHNSNMTRLAHEVMILAGEPQGEWHVFVDANTGEIFKVKNMLHYYCKDKAHTEACTHGDPPSEKDKNKITTNNNSNRSMVAVVDGTGLTFDPDPLSSNMVAYGGNYSDNNDATNVDLDAARFTVPLREIEELAGVYKLLGPWAEVRDHDTPTNGLFTQNSSVFNFDRENDAFEAVTCYFHIDSMMRYINIDLGCVAEPFQYTGGVRFDPSGAGGADNSFYSGGAGTLTFGEGCVDDGEDSDVIHHELGHFLHDMVTSGGLSQNEGLSEGCGDYVAQTYNRSLGNWTPSDPAYNWVFNWDGHNECWAGRVTNNPDGYPAGLGGGLHSDGTVWSSCLMTVWDLIGRDQMDKIFYEGLGMTNGSSNQDDAANMVYQAAINLNYTSSELAMIHSSLTACGYTLPALDGPPVAAISESATTICIDNVTSIDFMDASISSPPATNWAWTFEGGTPATSTLQNPTVSYSAEGTWDVSLTVTNTNGNDMISLTDHISTFAGSNCPSCLSGSNNTVVPISEVGAGNIYTSVINVPTGGTINDVNVTNITGIHSYLGDLVFSLISPNNTTVQLNTAVCGTDEDFNVGFDDQAASGTLPCPYTDGMLYIPTQSLSLFNGEDAAGDWTLQILDSFDADGGELQSWSVEVCIDAPTSNCMTDIDVTNPVTDTYNASNSVISSATVVATNNVVFRGGSYVELLPNFEVQLNAEFLGEIGPCP